MYSVSLKGKNNANKFFAAKQIIKVLLNNKKRYYSTLKKRVQNTSKVKKSPKNSALKNKTKNAVEQ
jgi:hypothetical protein